MGKSKKADKLQGPAKGAADATEPHKPQAKRKRGAKQKADKADKVETADKVEKVEQAGSVDKTGRAAKKGAAAKSPAPAPAPAPAVAPAGPAHALAKSDAAAPPANALLAAPAPGVERLSRRAYEEAVDHLALALNRLARWLQHTGQRVAVVVEGRDTAGKGGVIGAISDHLSPRQCRVVALPKPDERERSQWYFQRYVAHLPAAGELVLFDRSWYNRAGVEPVMGFCTPEQTAAFLRQAPVFEQLLVDDGILLFKYWLTVDQAEQEARFGERLGDPLKRWKLSPIDLKSREKYAEYGQARDAMLRATHRPNTPWTLVDFNDQRRGRLTLIHDLLARIPEFEVPETLVPYPPLTKPPLREHFSGPLKPIKPWR